MTRNNGSKPTGKRKNISVRPKPDELEQLHERAASFGYKLDFIHFESAKMPVA